LGLVSRGGVIPLSLTFDTPGVMARSAKDVERILEAIAGTDARDAATAQQPASRNDPLHTPRSTATPTVRGLRLGVLSNFRGGNAEVDAVQDGAVKLLDSRGAILIPVTLPAPFEHLWPAVLAPVGEAEFKPEFERYLRTLPAAMPKTLAQLIAIGESRAVAESATPVNPARLEALRKADATELTDSPTYIRILTQTIPELRRQLLALMDAYGLQGFVFSTMSCPASPRFDRPDPGYLCSSADPYAPSYVAAAAGFPEVTVPAGTVWGNLPVGVSFMGRPFAETQLLGIAEAFQTALALHIEPPVLNPQRREKTSSKRLAAQR
jgi:amidase